MRIMHISSALTWRGGEQQIAWLIEGLSTNAVDNFVFCAKNSAMEKHCKENNIPFFSYTKRGGVSFSTARLLAQQAKKNKVDIVHLHDAHAHTYGAMAATIFGCKKKMVLSRRVDFPIKAKFFTQWKYNHPAIEKIICVSKFIAELVKSGVKRPERVTTVHSGVNPNRFLNSSNGNLRSMLNIKNNQILVGNIAALAPHKDHITFVNACEIILKENPEVQFVIIGGDGGTQKSVTDYIKEKGMESNIQLLGFRTDVPDLIRDLDIFLFSSKTEGLGTSVIDAMAAELPIVTTNAGGIPEIVEHLKNGWLAEVENANELAKGVLYAIEHPEITKQWTLLGMQKLELFDKKNTASKTRRIYEEIIQKS